MLLKLWATETPQQALLSHGSDEPAKMGRSLHELKQNVNKGCSWPPPTGRMKTNTIHNPQSDAGYTYDDGCTR
jgi:hypothetical protein